MPAIQPLDTVRDVVAEAGFRPRFSLTPPRTAKRGPKPARQGTPTTTPLDPPAGDREVGTKM
jgi:hypothetical protein